MTHLWWGGEQTNYTEMNGGVLPSKLGDGNNYHTQSMPLKKEVMSNN